MFSALAQVNSHLDSCTEWRSFCPADLLRSCLCIGVARVSECCLPVYSAGLPRPSGSHRCPKARRCLLHLAEPPEGNEPGSAPGNLLVSRSSQPAIQPARGFTSWENEGWPFHLTVCPGPSLSPCWSQGFLLRCPWCSSSVIFSAFHLPCVFSFPWLGTASWCPRFVS